MGRNGWRWAARTLRTFPSSVRVSQLTSGFYVGRGFFITLQFLLLALVGVGWLLIYGLRATKAFPL